MPNSRNFSGLAKYRYLVRWDGYSAAESSWVPYENVSHLSELQAYVSEHDDLRFAVKKQLQDVTTVDSEEEDVLEMQAAKLLRLVRERRASRSEHCDEEQCFKITFVRCFFKEFTRKLEWFKQSDSHRYEMDFSSWCPELVFDVFWRKCVSWAKGEEQAGNHGDFSEELLTVSDEVLLNERLVVVRFSIAAPSIPFHVLGLVPETVVPWRQSAKPWYAHAWKVQQEVANPFVDNFNSTTSVLHCRMIAGKVHITYNRGKQSLAISCNYCHMQNSHSFLAADFMPIGCTQSTLDSVHEIVYNKVLLLAEELQDEV